MSKRIIIIGIALLALSTTIILVALNRKGIGNKKEPEMVTKAQNAEDSSLNDTTEAFTLEVEDESAGSSKDAGGGVVVASGQNSVEASTVKPEQQMTVGVPEASENVSQNMATGELAISEALLNKGEVSSEEAVIEEIELPMELDVPEDWDWKTFPTQAPKKENSTTYPTDDGESSGKENTEKSGEVESSTTEGEPEGQAAEESSKSDEEESRKEDVTEKSGEDSSTEQGEPEEQSSEDTESETETSTLSPEEQASIVESLTAPIELPPIFFN